MSEKGIFEDIMDLLMNPSRAQEQFQKEYLEE